MRLHNYTSSSVCVSFANIKKYFFIKRVDTSLYSLKKLEIMLGLTGVFSNIFLCSLANKSLKSLEKQ